MILLDKPVTKCQDHHARSGSILLQYINQSIVEFFIYHLHSGILFITSKNRAVSHNSFLNAKVRSSSEYSRPPVDKNCNVSNLDQTDESPTTLTKTPTYEYYGFTLYLTSFIAFGKYTP